MSNLKPAIELIEQAQASQPQARVLLVTKYLSTNEPAIILVVRRAAIQCLLESNEEKGWLELNALITKESIK